MNNLPRWATLILFFVSLFGGPSALAGGDRSGELRLIHGTTGLRGEVRWGDAGVRLDFTYPLSPGRTAEATLAIRADTGRALLMLHSTGEVVEGDWALSDSPSPLDLLAPGLSAMKVSPAGRVVLGQLPCDVWSGGRDGSLRVWYPTAFPDIPRMARLMGEDGASELSISRPRPTTLRPEELVAPEGYAVLPFGLSDLMVKATESEKAAVLGARAVVWMATANLEKQMQSVEYLIMVEAD